MVWKFKKDSGQDSFSKNFPVLKRLPLLLLCAGLLLPARTVPRQLKGGGSVSPLRLFDQKNCDPALPPDVRKVKTFEKDLPENSVLPEKGGDAYLPDQDFRIRQKYLEKGKMQLIPGISLI